MMLNNIPVSWQLVKFGESCTFSQGIQVDVGLQSEIKGDNQVRFLRIIDFTKGDEPPRYIDHPGDRYYLRKEEIAMVRYGTVGFVCTGKEGVIANNLFKITPLEFLSVPYLRVFLQSDHFKSKLESKGATMQALSFGLINPIEIPLPPLAEQHRIVAKIEELFGDLDKGIETLKTAKEQLKVYRQAVLKYAFEGRLTNSDVKEGTLSDGWEVKTFGNCTINLDGKRVPLSREVRAKRKGNFRYYGATEIVDYIDDFIFEGRFLLIGEDGANLLSKSKPLSHIAEGQFWVNNHAHIVQAVEGIKLDYLCHFINAMFLDEYVTGTAQPKLTQSNMNKIPVAIPISLKEQEEIIQEIESRLSICDKIEESIEQGLHQAEALRQSILKKAFEGKLVPQDPNDEPAHVLLARIKAERAAVQPIKKQKKAKA